jgi:signal transduction histidine kinase
VSIAAASNSRRDPANILPALQQPLLTALAYYASAEAAFAVGTLSDKIFAPFWPPNVVLFCALLFSTPRRWPLIILACVPPHLLAEYSVGMPFEQSAIAFATNCAVALLNASCLRLLTDRLRLFSTLRNAGIYIVVTVVACPAAAALGGAFVQISGGQPIGNYGHYWAQWYASNAVGAATLGPVGIILLERGVRSAWKPFASRPIEAIAAFAMLVLTSVIAFNITPKTVAAAYLPTMLYLPLPLILWTAFRFGVGAASGAVLVTGAILLWNSLNGPNLFTINNSETNVFSLQIFLIGLAVPILLLSTAIEEARRAHLEVREREERMAVAAAASDVGLWLYNYDTGRFWATDHSRVMFGVPDGRPLDARELLARIEPADRDAAGAAMRHAIRDRLPMDVEFRVTDNGGATRWISARARPQIGADGEDTELSGTFADITARKAAEEAALRKQQEIVHLMRVSMLGELSAGLAHELTQPLTAILSNAQAGRMLLGMPNPDTDEIAGILDDIVAEDERAGEVIHRLRALLRKGDVHFETIGMNDLIESTLRLLHSELIGRHVTVKLDLDRGLGQVKGDAVQLQQVLMNLLLNAMDAMEELSPPLRTIAIATRMNERKEIEVRITDGGTGLTASQRQIFQPFFTTKRSGLGLGLSICETIAKSHGGTLSLEDNSGRGATATFRIPAMVV